MSSIAIVDPSGREGQPLVTLAGALSEVNDVHCYLNASTGVAEWLTRKNPDLVVAVCTEADGLTLIQLLRRLQQLAETPILAVTADDDPATRQLLLHAGASDYLLAPTTPCEFNARAGNLLLIGRQTVTARVPVVNTVGRRPTLVSKIPAKAPPLPGRSTGAITRSVEYARPQQPEQGRRDQHEFLRAAIDLNPNFIFATDHLGRIGLANQAFAEAYGTTPELLIGAEHAAFAASISEARELLDEIHRVLDKSLQRLDVERLFTQVGGHQSWMRISHVPLVHLGEPMVLTVGTDVSALKRAEQAMREAKHQAELSDPSKSGFLTNMSHELRTPLNAILGFSEMISEQMLGPISVPRYREYARDIGESATRLLAVIDDILDLSRIETGKIELHEEEIYLRDALATVERLVTERAKAEEIALRFSIRPDLPALNADPQRIKQVLLNLLSNAIKFTQRGGAISVTADMDTTGGLRIVIADTGIGMEEAEIPLALWRFSQIDSALTRSYTGTGLGLPLSDAFLEMHQATLDLSSVKGVGTTATIRFPAARTIRQQLWAAG